MKKLVLSFAAFLLILTQGFSQDDRGYFGVSIGSSIPVGDFALAEITDEAGWAKAGAVVDLTFSYRIGESNFGVTAMLRGQANQVDDQGRADEFAKQNPGVNYTVESKPWSMGGFLVGGFAAFPISYIATFQARAMVGYLNASSPTIDLTAAANGASGWLKQESGSATSFTYLIGAGFKIDISNNLYLLTNLDYMSAEPEFKNVKTTYSDGSSDSVDFKQKIETVNISAGIAFKF
jgi:opacity protein-like surface antigen